MSDCDGVNVTPPHTQTPERAGEESIAWFRRSECRDSLRAARQLKALTEAGRRGGGRYLFCLSLTGRESRGGVVLNVGEKDQELGSGFLRGSKILPK